LNHADTGTEQRCRRPCSCEKAHRRGTAMTYDEMIADTLDELARIAEQQHS
jgi:hypothetical protein